MKRRQTIAHPCMWGFAATKDRSLPIRGNCFPVGWKESVGDDMSFLNDLTEEREATLREKCLSRAKAGTVRRWMYLIRLCAEVRKGDIVVYNNASGGSVMIGRVADGAWTYEDGSVLPCRRAVEWIAEVPKREMSRGFAARISPQCTIHPMTGEREREVFEVLERKGLL